MYFFTLLEQFQVLPIFSIFFNYLGLNITNEATILLLIFLYFTILYFSFLMFSKDGTLFFLLLPFTIIIFANFTYVYMEDEILRVSHWIRIKNLFISIFIYMLLHLPGFVSEVFNRMELHRKKSENNKKKIFSKKFKKRLFSKKQRFKKNCNKF